MIRWLCANNRNAFEDGIKGTKWWNPVYRTYFSVNTKKLRGNNGLSTNQHTRISFASSLNLFFRTRSAGWHKIMPTWEKENCHKISFGHWIIICMKITWKHKIAHWPILYCLAQPNPDLLFDHIIFPQSHMYHRSYDTDNIITWQNYLHTDRPYLWLRSHKSIFIFGQMTGVMHFYGISLPYLIFNYNSLMSTVFHFHWSHWEEGSEKDR